MKTVLILSAPTGGGHDKAAKNLEKILELNGFKVHIINFLKEIHPSVDYLVSNSYRQMSLYSPKTFGALYLLSNEKYVNQSLSKSMSGIGKRRISHSINQYNPDIIISTHLLATAIIGKMKSKKMIDIPFISVVTDFITHRSYVNNYVDAYITASDVTNFTLLNKGIDEKKLFTHGIPVDPKFYEKKCAKNNSFTILIMGGYLGLNFIDDSLSEIYENNIDVNCIVVCGKNQKLYDSLSLKYKTYIDSGKIELHGFSDSIDELMDKSHVVLSKPGGLTTSESIVKGLPMIIPHVIPGQESENARFLANAGAGIIVDKIYSISFIVNKLSTDPSYYDLMKNSITKLSESFSNDKIISLINNLIDNSSNIDDNPTL